MLFDRIKHSWADVRSYWIMWWSGDGGRYCGHNNIQKKYITQDPFSFDIIARKEILLKYGVFT
jgi:hypothetical protein